MEPLRILIVIEAANITGPAKNLLRLARMGQSPPPGLPALDISFATFARNPSAGGETPFLQAASQSGIPVAVISEAGRFDPTVIGGLRQVLRQKRAAILQTHAVKSNFLVWLSGLHHHYPWLAFHHGYTAEDWKARLYNKLNRISLPSARRVVTVCEPFAADIARYGVRRERVHVLPNAIEDSPAPPERAVSELRRRFELKPGEAIVLTAGRFSKEKAQIDLVRAAAIVARQDPAPRFRLLLLGDGPDLAEVKAEAARLGLAGNCIFPGHQQDTAPYFALATHFALPSLSEGSPNVLLEAMAAGLPVLSTQVGGVGEIVAHEESALLCPPGRPEQFAEGLARLLKEEALAASLAHAARARLEAFRPERYYRSLTEIYRRLLAEDSSQAASAAITR